MALVSALALAAKPAYYPHALGLTWVYSSGEVQSFVELRSMAGAEVWMLEHRYADGATMTEALAYRDDGVWLFAAVAGGATMVYDPPLKLYPAPPLRAGMAWSGRTKLNGRKMEVSSRVLGLEGVVVKAGRFNAFRIRSTLVTVGGTRSVVDYYFVPGVGVVRYATADGGVIDLVEFYQR